MTIKRKQQIRTLLKGIETGDEKSIAVVNPDKYIQHNPQTREGGEGLAALFKRLAKSSPRVNIVRIFSDGDFIFGHTEYDFDTSRVGFEIFRFEGEQTVEHWDNIQPREGPNSAGFSMVDGPTEAVELDQTEDNRKIVRSFVEDVLIDDQPGKLEHFMDTKTFIEHSARDEGDLAKLSTSATTGAFTKKYDLLHCVLAEGNFALTVSEGFVNEVHSSFFDLFRVDSGKIAEHWETTEAVPPKSEWKNDNGKFQGLR